MEDTPRLMLVVQPTPYRPFSKHKVIGIYQILHTLAYEASLHLYDRHPNNVIRCQHLILNTFELGHSPQF